MLDVDEQAWLYLCKQLEDVSLDLQCINIDSLCLPRS